MATDTTNQSSQPPKYEFHNDGLEEILVGIGLAILAFSNSLIKMIDIKWWIGFPLAGFFLPAFIIVTLWLLSKKIRKFLWKKFGAVEGFWEKEGIQVLHRKVSLKTILVVLVLIIFPFAFLRWLSYLPEGPFSRVDFTNWAIGFSGAVFGFLFSDATQKQRFSFLGGGIYLLTFLLDFLMDLDPALELTLTLYAIGFLLLIVGSAVFLRFIRRTIATEEQETHEN